MDELTRFKDRLVKRLAARPEGAERPVTVRQIRDEVLPYGSQRRALGLESVEDYETVLMRLVAEERGYARTSPATAAARCRQELGQPNPDLSVLDGLASAAIQLAPESGWSTVEPAPPVPQERAPAPNPPTPAPAPVPAAAPAPRPALARSAGGSCPQCQKAIPGGRTVTFCPWCGNRLVPLICARCDSEFESEWRHCITCGAPVSDPWRST